MDKEAQEKIKAILRHYFREQLGLAAAIDIADEILEAIGYRKLPKDKPPLLSDEEIDRIFKGKAIFASSPEMEREAIASLVAQAQRESDIKFYEGK